MTSAGVDLLRPLAGADVEHGDLPGGALEHVAIAGHEEGLAAGLGLELGEAAEQVVGLERLVIGDRPPERLEVVAGVGPLGLQPVGHLRAGGVVGRVELGPVGGGVGTEAEHDGARLAGLGLLEDQVRRAEQRVDRVAVGALDRVGERVERAVEHRGGVNR